MRTKESEGWEGLVVERSYNCMSVFVLLKKEENTNEPSQSVLVFIAHIKYADWIEPDKKFGRTKHTEIK